MFQNYLAADVDVSGMVVDHRCLSDDHTMHSRAKPNFWAGTSWPVW